MPRAILGLLLLLAPLLPWLPARADSPPGGAPGIDERFRQLDRDGDGRVTRAEAGPMPLFDRYDADGDGAVTLEEVRAYYGAGGGAGPAPRAADAAGPSSPAAPTHLVLVSIDACRPDYLEMAEVPNIRRLMEAGVTYEQAWVGQLRNDTPPGHVTMATGAFPRTHGVIGFHWRDPATRRRYKPTTWFGVARGELNDLVAQSGCSSIGSIYRQAFPGAKVAAFSSDKFYAAAALGANSADFIGYCRYSDPMGFGTKVGQMLAPETVTGRRIPTDIMGRPELTRKVEHPWDGDTWTVDLALALLETERPDVLLVNLALTDDVGHQHGAETGREHIVPIVENVDRQIGRLVDAYRRAGLEDRTAFVVTSDHGMSANGREIDETRMAPIVAEYGLERTAARLEFYVRDPSRAGEAADRIASLRLPGIHAVYHKAPVGGGGSPYLPAAGLAVDAALDACFRYLTSTYAGATSADVVCFPAEHWNVRESTSYFRADHGTTTWQNQHIPLVISGPGLRRGVRSQAPARLVDVVPTLLCAMGLAAKGMDGIVLADALIAPSEDLVRTQTASDAVLAPLRDALRQRSVMDVAAPLAAPTPPEARGVDSAALQHFRRLDRDGDGRVTRQEAGGAAWFERVDRDDDGAITAAEVAALASAADLSPAGRAPGASAAERMWELDRDRDGKVSREEAGDAPWFAPMDRNKDGFLTADETGRPAQEARPRPAGEDGEAHDPGAAGSGPPPIQRFFAYRRDYTAGTRDPNGRMRTGQELMSIRAYRGQLFAATSVFTDPRLYIEGDPDYTGCQILRKSGPRSEWEVEASFGKRYLRTDYLDVVCFTRDEDGKTLPQPVEMLVATVWDVGEIVRDSRIGGRDRRLTLAVRDDATGEWTLVPGESVPDAERGFACIRSLIVHTDKVTGRQYLFIAAGCGGMYRAVYDPMAPGRIRWLEGDELDKRYGRGQSMCVANGDLYASYDYGGLLVQDQVGGVFRRVDGPEPRWERVYRNHDPKYPTWNQTGRGITAVPAEDGSGKEVLLVGIENPPEPIIVRIEPHNGHRAVTEVDYNGYFTRVFGRKPQMLGGSALHPHAGNEIPALNRFDPFIDPETGKRQHFVTLFLFHPDDPAEGCNNAYFLIRRAPGQYDWGEVISDLPAGESLRGVRTIEKSPFPDEPNTYYFGGFFTGPDVQPPRPNLAWIFTGVVGRREAGSVKTAPAARIVPPVRYEDRERGFSFRYPGDMVRARPSVLAMPDPSQAPVIVVQATTSQSIREAAAQALRSASATPEPLDYTESNLYLGSSTGVAGNLLPGGRVGRRFAFRDRSGDEQPARSAVGMGWTEGDATVVIAVLYWGACTEGQANVLLNQIIVSLEIGPARGAARAPAPGREQR